MKPGYWPDLPKMQQTIHDAGYKPIEGGVALRVSGKLVKQGEAAGLALELDGMKAPITLTLTAAKEAPGLLAQLAPRAGEVVELEGRWSAAEAGQPGPGILTVTEIAGAAARGGPG